MAKNTYAKIWKNCATCEFWCGERKALPPESVEVDSSAISTCKGFWNGSRKYGNAKCTEWKVWSELSDGTDDAPLPYPQ